MIQTNSTSSDIINRKKQLATLNQNLNILREREAKYAGNAPLDLLNQIEDHRQAIELIEQTLAGQLTDEELAVALKPLLLAFHKGQVINITAETYVAGDQIIQNISHLTERVLTAAEAAEKARSIAAQRLAEGVSQYAHRLANIATADADPETGSPYKGLLAYRLSDAARFFGRERAIAELMTQLQQCPLTILHAESGAGKSSLLQAGIANRLLGQGHLPVYLRPYDQSPTLAIKRVFVPHLTDTPELAEASLRDFLRQVTGVLGPDATLYLLLDQFEEVFTLLDDNTRNQFVIELAECLDDESLNVRWVLALRTEFFGNLANFRPRIRNPFENDYRLNRLTRVEAQAVIVEPAIRQGIRFEPELVETLLNDLRDEDSGEVAPPQIQLVCSALYNTLLERQIADPNLPPTITLQMYEEEGRAQGILRGHLNRVLRRTLKPNEREAARQLLIALVSSDQRRIRRTRSDLTATLTTYLTSAMSLDGLLDQLVESRLLNVEEDEATDEPAYELAHDYLLTEIKIDPETQARKAAEELLKQEVGAFKRHGTLLSADKFDIINSQREFLTLDDAAAKLLRLSQAARRRAQVQRMGAIAVVVLLVVGAAVTIALIQSRSAEQQAIAAQTAEAGAIQAKIAEESAQVQANNALRAERTAQAERDIAASQKATAEAASTVAIEQQNIAVTAQKQAEHNEAEANRQANIALSRQLAAQAQNLLAENPQMAILLASEAQAIAKTEEAAHILARAYFFASPIVAIFAKHTASVKDVCFSPNGQQLASASDDNTVILWDISTGHPNMVLKHPAGVNSISFSPDGKQLASALNNNTVMLWDLISSQPEGRLYGHTGPVESVAYSPDGKWLASASADGLVILWDTETRQAVLTLVGQAGEVRGVAFSPDSSQLASASADKSIILWNVANGEEVRRFIGHDDKVMDVTFSPDGRKLASAADDQTIIVWDTRSGQVIKTLSGHLGRVRSVTFSPDGSQLASAAADKSVRIWDLESGQPVMTLMEHTDDVRSVSFSPDGKQLASASADKSVILWNIASDPPISTLQKHKGWVTSVAYSPDGRQLASGSEDKSVILWDVATGQPIKELLGHTEWIWDVAFRPDGQQIASGADDDKIIMWDVATGQITRVLAGHTGNIRSVAYSPDGSQLASASDDRTVMLWDVASGQPIGRLSGHMANVWDVSFSPNGQQLASASADGTIILWDLNSRQPIARLTKHKGWVWSVAYSPDGKWLASAADDQSIILWDIANQQPVKKLQGHTDRVLSVVFSPDSKKLVSASGDKTVILWDIASGEQVTKLAGHSDIVWDVVFSPDGSQLASASGDRMIHLLKTEFIQQSPCELVQRNLANVEWQRYMPASLAYHRTCPNLAIHPTVIESVRDLAREGKIDEAIVQFKYLLTLNPTLDLNPEAEAHRVLQETVQSLLDEGQELARTGDIEQATAKFQKAKQLNPNLDLDPKAEAQRLAEPTFDNILDAAVAAAGKGDSETAKSKFEKAFALAASLNIAEIWHRLCMVGGRWEQAKVVLGACDKAIELESTNGQYYNSRGIVRLQLEDMAGAREDFAVFEKWLQENQK